MARDFTSGHTTQSRKSCSAVAADTYFLSLLNLEPQHAFPLTALKATTSGKQQPRGHMSSHQQDPKLAKQKVTFPADTEHNTAHSSTPPPPPTHTHAHRLTCNPVRQPL